MIKRFFIAFFVLVFFTSIYANLLLFANSNQENIEETSQESDYSIFISNSNNLFWPTPGYHTITSPFGSRISPITKKSSFHSGIDIGSAEGSLIYSASTGVVSFVGFNGANGYSIHIDSGNLKFIYGHVSPNFIVSKRK